MISQTNLKSVLNYNPETGVFIWLVHKAARIKVGQIAGYTSRGYRHIRINGRHYRAHRLAWLYMTGHYPEYPAEEIDHINRIKDDNRWKNLRLASRAENAANTLTKISNTGYRGVVKQTNSTKYEARIRKNGKLIHLGTFNTPKEAALAYDRAAKELNGEFSVFNFQVS